MFLYLAPKEKNLNIKYVLSLPVAFVGTVGALINIYRFTGDVCCRSARKLKKVCI